MSSDATYNTKVRMIQGGDQLDVAPGGKITADGGQASLVAPVNTAPTNSTPYGFTQAQATALLTWVIAADAQLRALGITI